MLQLFGARPRPSLAVLSRTLVAVAALSLASACSGDDGSGGGSGGGGGGGGGGFGLEANHKIAVTENGGTIQRDSVLTISAGEVGAGETVTRNLVIRNEGKAGGGNPGLTLTKIAFEYQAASPAEAAEPALRCIVPSQNNIDCAQAVLPKDIVPLGDAGTKDFSIAIQFKRYDDQLARSARVVITSEDDNAGNKTFPIKIEAALGFPKLSVKPGTLDFGMAPVGASPTAKLQLINLGSAPLTISRMDTSTLPSDRFSFVLSGKEVAAGQAIDFDPALVIDPAGVLDVQAVYQSLDDQPKLGEILLTTNDLTIQSPGPGIKRIPVKVNSTGPCLTVSPSQVIFGATPVGSPKKQVLSLKSCGDEPALVSKLAFVTPPGEGNFAIDWPSVAASGGVAPTTNAPITVPVNGTIQIPLIYTPAALSEIGSDGKPVPDTARIEVVANTSLGIYNVNLEGVGANGDCPTAVIGIAEGDTVVPQTILNLDGKQSYANSGAIKQWKWEVDQPAGSVGLFTPNDKADTVKFQPNVAGEYTFRLRVWDESGKESCFAAERKVNVIPDQAIHVELLWETPGDKDESDSGPGAGSDLDLHFAHQYAAGFDFDGDGQPDPWFADKWDCFWQNCGNGNQVEWGSYDPNVDDDPTLDRDDTDGAGPENLNLTLPEDNRTYSVGVHYYNDFGKGLSRATVRIYIYGELQFEVQSPDLVKGDMWYVARVAWSSSPSIDSAQKDPSTPPPFITAKYPAPSLD